MSASETNPTLALASKKIPVESAKALKAYANYELLGNERTLPKLVEWYRVQATKQPDTTDSNQKPYIPDLSTLKRWSADYGWQTRLVSYEQTQLEVRRKKRLAEVDKMDLEQATVGHAYMVRAMERIDRLMKSSVAADFPAPSAVALLKLSYEMERIARGAATARLEASGPDGGPLMVNTQVGFYPVLLPEKDAPPDAIIGQGDEP